MEAFIITIHPQYAEVCCTNLYLYFSPADIDYVTLVQNIVFVSGETSNVFTVTIINDTIAESNELFEVFLKLLPGSTGVAIGQPSIATGIIVDDEVPGKIFAMSSGSVSRAMACSVHI